MSEELRNIFDGWAKKKYPESANSEVEALRSFQRLAYTAGCIAFVDVLVKFSIWRDDKKNGLTSRLMFELYKDKPLTHEDFLIHFLTNVYQSPIK